MDNKIEKRYRPIELRADKETRKIAGTAIVFNSKSVDLGGFIETIEPTAVTNELINNSDIVMLYNHQDSSGVLARSKNGKGSLSINITNSGVDFEFTAKRTSLGDEVLEAILAGDLDACSFAFRLADDGDRWEKLTSDTYVRTITKFESLHDMSIVINPAYPATSVSARSLDKLAELRKADEVVEEVIIPQPTEDELRKKKEAEAKFQLHLKNLKSKYLQ